MMNESFGGGWGDADTTFAAQGGTGKDSASTRLVEKLPVPATISDLATIDPTKERYELGTYPFATVQTMGIVKDVENTTDNSVNYTLADPSDESITFKVNNYHGIEEDVSSSVMEGTRVLAVGKLRSFDGNVVLFAYKVHEVEKDEEYKIFTLQAKCAKLYFTKNVPELLRSADPATLARLKGTACGIVEQPEGAGTGTSHVNQTGQAAKDGGGAHGGQRLYENNGDSKSLAGNQQKIYQYLASNKRDDDETGVSVEDMTRVLKIPMKALRQELDALCDKGQVYMTSDEDHWTIV